MEKIKTMPYIIVLTILGILSTGSLTFSAPSSIGGTIQYSKNSTVVSLNVSCGGMQPVMSAHDTILPKITFEIPKGSDQWHFDLLVTAAKIEYQLKDSAEQQEIQNTVDYLKIDPNNSYKYYSLDFIDNEWKIVDQVLPKNGKLPDRTIIIECYPEWIQDVKGGSAVELPTVYLNNEIANADLTQEDFQEALIKLELSALDSHIIHAPMRRKTQTISDKKRILIMDLLA